MTEQKKYIAGPGLPEAGWIGTDRLPGHQEVICEWVGEADRIGKAVLYRNPDDLLYVDRVDRFAWRPPAGIAEARKRVDGNG